MNSRHSIFLIAKTVWIDFSRRKDFFVLLSALLLFVVAALSARVIGIKDDGAARLLLSCGLGLASSLSAILVVLFTSRQMPEEFAARTLYPLLAKPVSRTTLLWAKFLGVFSMGAVALVLFVALAWLPVPKPATVHPGLLLQAILLQIIALAVLAWLAIWLSIRLPSLVCSLLVLMLYFMAGTIMQFAVNAADAHSAGSGRILAHVVGVMPDPSALNFFQSYVEGAHPMGVFAFGALALYGGVFVALFALLSIQSFVRKPL